MNRAVGRARGSSDVRGVTMSLEAGWSAVHNTLGLQMLGRLALAARRLGGRSLLPRSGAGWEDKEERSRPPTGLQMAPVVPLALLGAMQEEDEELEQGRIQVSLYFLVTSLYLPFPRRVRRPRRRQASPSGISSQVS